MSNDIKIGRELAERILKWLHSDEPDGWASELRALLAAPVVERQPVPEYFVEACDKFDWTPEEALRFYADGKHFDTENGRTRILCSGAIASYALKNLNGDYAKLKGAEQPAPVAVVLDRYTCIGKGGEYELLGNAIGAGTLKDMSAIPVYRDTTTGQLFVRTPLDFQTRMESLDKVKELIPTTAAASNNLRNFANAMIDIALDGADADGGHIQELAIKHGLLKPEQRTERCGDACSCAEYADFPVECFRKVKELNQ